MDETKLKTITEFLDYCTAYGWIKISNKSIILNDYLNSINPDLLCPNCKSNNVVDVDDHWSKCCSCHFSFVGC